MDNKKIECEAEFLSLLAQPTRLKILYLLKSGEKCACEITPSMAEDPSVISRHLVKMREAGILDSRREGVSIFYRIRDPRAFKLLKLVDQILLRRAEEKVQLLA